MEAKDDPHGVTVWHCPTRTSGVPGAEAKSKKGVGKSERWHSDPSILGICPQFSLGDGTQKPKKPDLLLHSLPKPPWSVEAQPGTQPGKQQVQCVGGKELVMIDLKPR